MFNSDLLDDLARERVVLFLGAGVSASAVTAKGSRISNWEDFLVEMRKLVPDEVGTQVDYYLGRKDYLLACEILQSTLAESWERHVTDEFGQKATPSPLHHSIVRLGQRIILTTNFDKLLEVAWEIADKNATHYPTVISSINENVFKTLKDHSGHYIFKIHGSIDDITSLVFSRSEYIKLAFGNINYSGFLENLLLNYTFLFIGFSMDDPAITSLMEMYALKYKNARPHYLFAPGPVAQNIIDINKKLRKLVYITYDKSEGHKNLSPMIDQLTQYANQRRREIFANFVSD